MTDKAPPTVTTIELTGKPIKKHLFIAKSVMTVGILMVLFGNQSAHTLVWGCLITMAGVIHLNYARVLKWWNHG